MNETNCIVELKKQLKHKDDLLKQKEKDIESLIHNLIIRYCQSDKTYLYIGSVGNNCIKIGISQGVSTFVLKQTFSSFVFLEAFPLPYYMHRKEQKELYSEILDNIRPYMDKWDKYLSRTEVFERFRTGFKSDDDDIVKLDKNFNYNTLVKLVLNLINKYKDKSSHILAEKTPDW